MSCVNFLRSVGVAALCATSMTLPTLAMEAAHEAAVEALGIEEGVAKNMLTVFEQIQKSPPTPEALFALLFKAQDHPIDMATLSEALGVDRLIADVVLPTKSSTQWAADIESLAWKTVEHSELTPEERAEALELIEVTKNAGFEMAGIITEMMEIKEQLDSGRRILDGESNEGDIVLTPEQRKELKERLRVLYDQLLAIQIGQKAPTERYFRLRKRYSYEGKDSLMRYDAVDRVTRFFKDKILAAFDPYI